MKLRTLICAFSAITIVVVLFNLTKQPFSTPATSQPTKPAKAKALHYSTVELNLMDKDTLEVHFKTATGRFKLDSLHHLIEMASSTELAGGVVSFKVLSDFTIRASY